MFVSKICFLNVRKYIKKGGVVKIEEVEENENGLILLHKDNG